MAGETNLLGEQKSLRGHRPVLPRSSFGAVVWLLLAILILVGTIFGSLYYFEKQKITQKTDIEFQIKEIDQKVEDRSENLNQVLGVQFSLNQVSSMLDDHIRFSQVWDELAEYTLKEVRFSTLQATTEPEKFIVGGGSSNFAQLGRVLLGLEFSPNFSKIKLLSSKPEPTTGTVQFEILVEVKPSLLKNHKFE